MGFPLSNLHSKDAYVKASSVDTDQTSPLGAVQSGSTLFAQTFLSENLGSLGYILLVVWGLQ